MDFEGATGATRARSGFEARPVRHQDDLQGKRKSTMESVFAKARLRLARVVRTVAIECPGRKSRELRKRECQFAGNVSRGFAGYADELHTHAANSDMD